MLPISRKNPLQRAAFVLLLLALAVLAGCAQPPITTYAELRNVTTAKDYLRVPVIFIPGVKGTRLVRDESGKVLWGLSGHVAFFSGFDDLALDYEMLATQDPEVFADYYRKKGIYSDQVLESYGLGLQQFTFHRAVVYKELLEFLTSKAGGEFKRVSEQGGSLFTLPYDWRLDNRIAAAQLALEIPHYRKQYEQLLRMEHCQRYRKVPACSPADLRRADVRKEFDDYIRGATEKYPHLFVDKDSRQPKIKFNIVAHSMGGLVAQYYISQLGGHADVHRFITLGTPSLGAMDALKAVAEGEYPETIWSSLFSFGFFPKRASNYISLSFPSVFQLFPRYDDAIFGAVSAKELGLSGPPSGLLLPQAEAGIWNRYREYQLIPDWEAAGRGGNQEKNEAVFRRYLSTQLISAACFHDSLDGKVEKECDEPGRVDSAIKFLLHVERDGRTLERWETAAAELNTRRSMPGKEIMFPGRVVYGGHCKSTVTRADFVASKPGVNSQPGIIFVEGIADADGSSYMGDGRVPIRSAEHHRPIEKWRGSFFICSDHVGLVKNESFRYNLLRVLLTDMHNLEELGQVTSRDPRVTGAHTPIPRK